MRPSALPLSSSSRVRGFSLLEVLISVIVLSFGVLGMVGLQAAALKSNRDARLQSEALGLARELAEIMRANPSVATKTAEADNPYLGNFKTGGMVPRSPSNCLDTSSTARCVDNVAVANAQMTEWLAGADRVLPGIRVVVCMDTASYFFECLS